MTDSNDGLYYPKFRLPVSGWWFTVVGTVAGLAVLMFPGLSLLSDGQRFCVFLLLIVMPGGIILLLHSTRCVSVFIKRALLYGRLTQAITSLEQRLGASQRSLTALLQERQQRNAFEIAYCYAFDHRTFVALKRKRGRSPTVGTDVAVIEQDSGALIGEFRVHKDADRYHICELVGYIDALWLGNVKQHGTQHSEPPPEAVAWILPGVIGEEHDGSEEEN
jgi:hypothetical protein